VKDKQRIRRVFHDQLVEVWRNEPLLLGQLQTWQKLPPQERATARTLVQGLDVGNFCFVPLVSKTHRMYCELDILFLRAEAPGMIFTTNHAGDLDNRLKVLFDALRVPIIGELPPADRPSGDEESPFFCLLQDDNLITAVRLESERLLESSQRGNRDRVRLVIRAIVRMQKGSSYSLWIGD